MSDIQLTLTADETELVIDALEADLDDYLEEARETRAAGDGEQAAIFSEAADRIRALLSTLQELLPENSASKRPGK